MIQNVFREQLHDYEYKRVTSVTGFPVTHTWLYDEADNFILSKLWFQTLYIDNKYLTHCSACIKTNGIQGDFDLQVASL